MLCLTPRQSLLPHIFAYDCVCVCLPVRRCLYVCAPGAAMLAIQQHNHLLVRLHSHLAAYLVNDKCETVQLGVMAELRK